MLDHYEKHLFIFEAENNVRFKRTHASWGRWWSVIVAAGMVTGNREMLMKFLVQMANEDKSPTYAPIARQTATWLANDMLWAQLCFLQGFCHSWWDVWFCFLQRKASWMELLSSAFVSGGFRAGEMPRSVCRMRQSLKDVEGLLYETEDLYFVAFRLALTALSPEKREDLKKQVGHFFKFAGAKFEKHFGRWNADLAECALDDPDPEVARWTMWSLLQIYDEEERTLGPDDTEVREKIELPENPEFPAAVKVVVDQMLRGLTNGEKRERLAKRSVHFQKAASVRTIRKWVADGGLAEDLEVGEMKILVEQIRIIRIQSQDTEHNVGMYKYLGGGANRGTDSGILATLHMLRGNRVMEERKFAMEMRKGEDKFRKDAATRAEKIRQDMPAGRAEENAKEATPDPRNKINVGLQMMALQDRVEKVSEKVRKDAAEFRRWQNSEGLDSRSRRRKILHMIVSNVKGGRFSETVAKEKGEGLVVAVPAETRGVLYLDAVLEDKSAVEFGVAWRRRKTVLQQECTAYGKTFKIGDTSKKLAEILEKAAGSRVVKRKTGEGEDWVEKWMDEGEEEEGEGVLASLDGPSAVVEGRPAGVEVSVDL